MNNFSPTKCYNFGKLIPREWKGTWDELLADGEWVTFQAKHKLTPTQIQYIYQGFHGEEMQMIEDDIMPFGTHKGKPLRDIHDSYYEWLSNQTWLDKWPTLACYTKIRIEEIKKKKLSPEEVKSLLKI